MSSKHRSHPNVPPPSSLRFWSVATSADVGAASSESDEYDVTAATAPLDEYDVARANPRYDGSMAPISVANAASLGRSRQFDEGAPEPGPNAGWTEADETNSFEQHSSRAIAPNGAAPAQEPTGDGPSSRQTEPPDSRASSPEPTAADRSPREEQPTEADDVGGMAEAASFAAPHSSARSNFTQNQLRGLIRDEDLLSDLQSIARGEPVPAKHETKAAPSKAMDAAPPRPAPPPPPAEQPTVTNEHAIFDKIAQNMQYANAYELGTVELSRRFDAFDADARLPRARDPR